MMTMPQSPVSGMPSTPGNATAYPGNAPVYSGNAPVYSGTVPGTDYADMQPAPQVAAPPGRGLGVASTCLGVIGSILCAIGLFAGVAAVLASTGDSLEWALAPIGFFLTVAMFYILGGIMNIIGLVLGKAGRKRAQDPRYAKACTVGIWLNAVPMIVFLVAEIFAVLWLIGAN